MMYLAIKKEGVNTYDNRYKQDIPALWQRKGP